MKSKKLYWLAVICFAIGVSTSLLMPLFVAISLEKLVMFSFIFFLYGMYLLGISSERYKKELIVERYEETLDREREYWQKKD